MVPGRQLTWAVITDLCILRFTAERREMTLTSLHPGVTVAAVQERIGWPLHIADQIATTPAPSEDEMAILRGELDVQGRFR